ncbi:MAG: hypothetical protein ACSLFA_28735, partial [Mycobacterium sp.]
MFKTSLAAIGFITVTSGILGTAPTAYAAPSAPALAVESVEEQNTPGPRSQAGRNKPNTSVNPIAGNVFTPPVTAPQQTVDPYND